MANHDDQARKNFAQVIASVNVATKTSSFTSPIFRPKSIINDNQSYQFDFSSNYPKKGQNNIADSSRQIYEPKKPNINSNISRATQQSQTTPPVRPLQESFEIISKYLNVKEVSKEIQDRIKLERSLRISVFGEAAENPATANTNNAPLPPEQCQYEVDYANYVPINIDSNSALNSGEIFNGILRYIFTRSENKENNYEFRFIYKSMKPGCFPGFSLDHSSPYFYYTDSSSKIQQYFGCEFRQIEIRPFAYSIRSGSDMRTPNYLVSFVFQGRKRNSTLWENLDEQVNTAAVARSFAANIFFIDTDSHYTEFRILQMGKSLAGNSAFCLAGFEIHGDVRKLQSSQRK